MAGWVSKKLMDVCVLQRGFDLPKVQRKSGDTPLVSSSGYIDFHSIAKVKGPGVVTGRSGSIGQVFYIKEDFWPLNTTLYIKDFHGNDPRFVYYLLQNFDLNKYTSGAGVPTLNRNHVHDEMVLVASCVEEQKRIVAILDEAFADIEQVRAKTEQNLKNAHELFESYLQQVFSQRGEGWVEKALGDVCKFENGDRGKNYPSRSKFVESGFAFINAGHIDDGTVDFSKMNYITEENYDLLSRGKVKQGDILFCLRGSLGKFAVIEGDIQGAIASSLVIIRPHSDLSISFLLHYLRSGLCKSMIEKYAGGAAQPNLGAKDLAKFSISVPPAAQQLQTSEKLNSLMAAVENLESVYSEKLAALDELKKSILQKAFSGELTKKTSLEVTHD